MATSSELLSYLKKKNLSQKAIGNIMGQYEAEGKHGNEENLNWNAKNLLMHFGDPGYTFTFRGKNYTVPSHRNKVRFKTLDDAQTTASQGADRLPWIASILLRRCLTGRVYSPAPFVGCSFCFSRYFPLA